ncbi:hypothetical protein CC1G_08938 [Coprinopsis cinerea okayama7|uniref:Uncharacterized protein n=1 Tax=Coprinopsis cinerea (strain Okayama-7 / 130 / ATCC MYA-4618 / FGSC 9003) TaxID=240176 RepID=A8P4M9_COPC7|nr:hypothetical protein CC1G_08938 [Coprinopsis cinerea okayama7\|eukprot:XP_001838774.2 hypothetical protein CC1G_08938 [Coprinopsis cinerea okayama7\
MSGASSTQEFNINWWLRVPEVEGLTNAYRNRNEYDVIRELCSFVAAEGRSFANTFTLLELGEGPDDDLIEYSLPLTSSELSKTVSLERGHRLTRRIMQVFHVSNGERESNLDEAPYVMKWLAEQMGVSPCFFEAALSSNDVAILELPPLRVQRVSPDAPYGRSLNGMYITQVTGSNTKVWFSHCLERNFSIYVIDDISPRAKANILEAIDLPLNSFLSLDSFICNDDHLFNSAYSKAFAQALHALNSLDPTDVPQSATSRRASQRASKFKFDHMTESYTDVYDISRAYDNKRRVVEFFKQLVKTRLRLASELYDPDLPNECIDEWHAVPRATAVLLTNMENTTLVRQAVVRDSLSMLGTMMNHKMAAFSSQLATDTRRDSSSMTTIALVTMFFLPGSFVASFFSTEFVRIIDRDETKPSHMLPLEFTPLAWIWCTITTGLTIAVIFLWSYHHGSIRRQFKGLRKLRKFVGLPRVETIVPRPQTDVNDALGSVPASFSTSPSSFLAEVKPHDGMASRNAKMHTVIEVKES